MGGLGIRRSIDMNKALLAKMGWSVAVREDKMWVCEVCSCQIFER